MSLLFSRENEFLDFQISAFILFYSTFLIFFQAFFYFDLLNFILFVVFLISFFL